MTLLTSCRYFTVLEFGNEFARARAYARKGTGCHGCHGHHRPSTDGWQFWGEIASPHPVASKEVTQ